MLSLISMTILEKPHYKTFKNLVQSLSRNRAR